VVVPDFGPSYSSGTLAPARQRLRGPVSTKADPIRVDDERPAHCGGTVTEEDQMKQYLLSVYHPEGDTLPPEDLAKVMEDVNALNQEIRAAGAWVFAGGLHPSSTATVLQLNGGDVLTTDGPFAEGKEHIGGLWVIKTEDLDSALEWGRKATLACTVAIEVRPFQDEPQD
jgi:hypothetical protein